MKQIILLLCSVIFMSCATGRVYTVNVESIRNHNQYENKSYVIVPVNAKDTLSGEYSNYKYYIQNILTLAGYYETSFNNANYFITLEYNISKPQHNSYVVNVPHTITTYNNATAKSNYNYNQRGYSSVSGYSNYRGKVSGTTNYNSTSKSVYYTPETRQYTYYDKVIIIRAYDKESINNNKMDLLWFTAGFSRGSDGDLYHTFPIIATTIHPYIEMNTRQKVKIREHDQKINFIRYGYEE